MGSYSRHGTAFDINAPYHILRYKKVILNTV